MHIILSCFFDQILRDKSLLEGDMLLPNQIRQLFSSLFFLPELDFKDFLGESDQSTASTSPST